MPAELVSSIMSINCPQLIKMNAISSGRTAFMIQYFDTRVKYSESSTGTGDKFTEIKMIKLQL
jgi:hypothetical protein